MQIQKNIPHRQSIEVIDLTGESTSSSEEGELPEDGDRKEGGNSPASEGGSSVEEGEILESTPGSGDARRSRKARLARLSMLANSSEHIKAGERLPRPDRYAKELQRAGLGIKSGGDRVQPPTQRTLDDNTMQNDSVSSAATNPDLCASDDSISDAGQNARQSPSPSVNDGEENESRDDSFWKVVDGGKVFTGRDAEEHLP